MRLHLDSNTSARFKDDTGSGNDTTGNSAVLDTDKLLLPISKAINKSENGLISNIDSTNLGLFLSLRRIHAMHAGDKGHMTCALLAAACATRTGMLKWKSLSFGTHAVRLCVEW